MYTLIRASMVIMLALCFSFSAEAHQKRTVVTDRLVAELSKQFDRDYVTGLFEGMGQLYHGSSVTCGLISDNVRSDIKRKREGKEPLTGYLLTDTNSLSAGLAYWRTYRRFFDEAEKRYGVPPEVILGMLRMETWFGECLGSYNALPALLNTRVIGARSEGWVLKEMEELIRFCLLSGCDPNTMPSSSRSAFGVSQFLPSSFWIFAVDGNADGVIDLFNDADAILSTAHYLEKNGFDESVARGSSCPPPRRADPQRHAVWQYNHTCTGYVDPVFRYARAVRPLLERDRKREAH